MWSDSCVSLSSKWKYRLNPCPAVMPSWLIPTAAYCCGASTQLDVASVKGWSMRHPFSSSRSIVSLRCFQCFLRLSRLTLIDSSTPCRANSGQVRRKPSADSVTLVNAASTTSKSSSSSMSSVAGALHSPLPDLYSLMYLRSDLAFCDATPVSLLGVTVLVRVLPVSFSSVTSSAISAHRFSTRSSMSSGYPPMLVIASPLPLLSIHLSQHPSCI